MYTPTPGQSHIHTHKTQGFGAGELQEFLDAIDKRSEQIRLGVLAALGEQAAAAAAAAASTQRRQGDGGDQGPGRDAGASIDPALLSAAVALADAAAPTGPELQQIAEHAKRYM